VGPGGFLFYKLCLFARGEFHFQLMVRFMIMVFYVAYYSTQISKIYKRTACFMMASGVEFFLLATLAVLLSQVSSLAKTPLYSFKGYASKGAGNVELAQALEKRGLETSRYFRKYN